jgi:TonB-linked SusC/RagA family outer membrane protein
MNIMRKLFYLVLLNLAMPLVYQPAYAQSTTVSGTVVAQEDSDPLQGVTVTNRNTNQKTQTNNVGYYSIAAEKGHVLQFTYVGYARQDVTVGDQKVMTIKLVSSQNELGEIVVTAYDIKKSKKELTYQVITVSGDEIASTRRENFINSLAGRIPGAMITSTTGMPGSSTSIVLRGPTSIDGSNQPIFVVDGLIIDNGAFEMKDRLPANPNLNMENRNNDFANRAADINPEDIESISVLKGPEATSLYGSDGANGAIIITTKKGKKGRTALSYNNSFRFEKVYRLPEIQNVYDQGIDGITNPSSRSYFGQRIADSVPRFDNLNNFFGTGRTQQHNLSVDGGSDIGTYRFTASYVNQNGVVPNTGFERYNFRLNTTFKLSSKINLTNTFSYIQSHTDKASKGSGGFLLSLLTWPLDDDASVYLNAAGNRKYIRSDIGAEDDNPFWDVNKNVSFDDNNRLLGNFQVSYDAAKWLNLTALMGIDYYNTRGTWFLHPESNVSRTSGGIFNQYRENQRLLNGAYRATVRKKYGKINNTLIGAFTFDSRTYEVNAVKGERLYEPDFLSINNTDPLTVASRTTAENFNRFGTFLTYNGNYNSWLNLSLSGRLDGSSRLVDPVNYQSKDALYAYWSVGTSLILSDMVKLPDVVRYAKLRFNYATTGRDPRTAYVKANSFNPSTVTGGGFAPGFTQGNPALRPEFSNQLETGIEAKFFDNRFGFDVAFYDNRVKDQLTAFRLSYASGAIIKWVNGGTVQNRGVEVQMTGTPIKAKNLNWDITVNFARNRNKITEMPPNVVNFYNSDTWIGNIRNNVTKGGNIYELSANRYQRNSNGDIVVSATSGIPLVIGDYTPVGDRQTDFNMGLINSFSFFKNLTLSFNLDIRKGGDVYNGTEEFLYRRGMSTRTLDRETPRVVKGVLNDGLQNTSKPTINTIVVTPFYRTDYYTTGSVSEDFIERDIDWVRMRDLTLAYNIPTTLIKRQKLIKSASVFVTGTDLFILTNYSGADPSANANNVSARGGIGGIGMDQGNLATPRGINVGLRASF